MYTNYEFELNGILATDLQAISELITQNAGIFEKYLLSAYGDDHRYTFEDDSFEITSIDEDHFEFRCDVSYYEGCSDKDGSLTSYGNVPYETHGNTIVLKLVEMDWDSDS